MEETFSREVLVQEVITRSLGPRGGVNEEVTCKEPSKWYLTGVIAPCVSESFLRPEEESDPDTEEITVQSGDEGDEGTSISHYSSTNDPNKLPCSFGISFAIEEGATFDVCITWGKYEKANQATDVWKRVGHCKILRGLKAINGKQTIYDAKDGKISLDIILHNMPTRRVISLMVVNNLCTNTNAPSSSTDCLFQPSIRVRTEGIIDYHSEKINLDSLLNRDSPVKGRGHNCSAVWKEIDYEDDACTSFTWPDKILNSEAIEFLAPAIRSEFTPISLVLAPDTEWNKNLTTAPELNPALLSQIWTDDEVRGCLMPIVEAYSNWKDESYRRTISELSEGRMSDGYRKYIDEIKNGHEKLIDSMKIGIELLIKNEKLRLAFCFMNRAISLQYEWEERQFIWRPFQLGFILNCIQSVSSKDPEIRKIMELLWVPTGGGKTEAYLAVVAMNIIFRRLLGTENSQRSEGTTVISRYTLRALTIQQFRRTIKLVTAMECLRQEKTSKGEGWRPSKCPLVEIDYGKESISCGLWVGGGVTPNTINKGNDDNDAVSILSNYTDNKKSDPVQVLSCPACGNMLCVPQQNRGLGETKAVWYLSSLPPSEEMLKSAIDVYVNGEKLFDDVEIIRKKDFCFVGIKNNDASKKMDIEGIDRLFASAGLFQKSFSTILPGYFPRYNTKHNKIIDFDVCCTNPYCPLNKRDQNTHPFVIPAYCVDEQIYSKCPTILISTVDKFAMIPFEPMCATIFGRVDCKNDDYGFSIESIRGVYDKKRGHEKSQWHSVSEFKPPELIVQDELHLIDGPLGSMYGLYELMTDTIIRARGIIPKYLSSSATVNNAEAQIKKTFARGLSTFPPVGYSMNDNFFIRTENKKRPLWRDNSPGRAYVGIVSPALGPLTPNVRLWAYLLNGGDKARLLDVKKNGFETTSKNYWTIVGYFNAIRELGGAVSLYKEDVREWLSLIPSKRHIDGEKIIELSSRKSSADISGSIERIEKGINNKDGTEKMIDAIFTTSLFGTGVDISYLSTMLINGQPKSTAQYIQASGRVGRSKGGLVVTFLRNNRPRDASHYELFCGYHSRLYLDVEPISVNPLSRRALQQAVGPVLVGILRSLYDYWASPESATISGDGSRLREDTIKIKRIIEERLIGYYCQDDIDIVEYFVDNSVNEWINQSEIVSNEGSNLKYNETSEYKKVSENVVLGSIAHNMNCDLHVVFRNAPTSLRNIEETTTFEV